MALIDTLSPLNWEHVLFCTRFSNFANTHIMLGRAPEGHCSLVDELLIRTTTQRVIVPPLILHNAKMYPGITENYFQRPLAWRFVLATL